MERPELPSMVGATNIAGTEYCQPAVVTDQMPTRMEHSKVQHYPRIAPTPPFFEAQRGTASHVQQGRTTRNAKLNHPQYMSMGSRGRNLDPCQSLLLTETQTARLHTPWSTEKANNSARKS